MRSDIAPSDPERPAGLDDKPTISAVIICFNEQSVLGDCLESLAFCEEIIVVDSGSSDGTLDVIDDCRRRGLPISLHKRDWPGFGPQKQFALSLATGDWILSLDADERITPSLQGEILAAISSAGPGAFDMPRLSTFCGRQMRHSGWWPDRVLRLFRRGKARFSDDLVHEAVVYEGPIGHLNSAMEHHPIRTLDDALRRMQTYSALGAEKLRHENRKPTFFTGILRGGFAFFKTYILKRGFLDGREGFLNAAIHSQTIFWKYMKGWMLINRAKS